MKINRLQTIIAHDNCPDGIVSALIIRDVFPNAKIRFVQYGTKEHDTLEVTADTIFVDFSPPRHRVSEFIEAGTIVLDHHISAKETVKAFGPNGVYANTPGISGAVLAFNEIWMPNTSQMQLSWKEREWKNKLHDIAILTGIRDTWYKTHPRFIEACYQSSGIMFMPMSFYYKTSAKEVFGDLWPRMQWIGQISFEKQQDRAKKAVEKGLRFSTKQKTRVLVIDGINHSSEAKEIASDIDLVFAFSFITDEVPKMIVSLRSSSNFDCASLAKFNGGGGHLRAAGFTITNPQKSPYTTAMEILEAFEMLTPPQ